VGSFVTAYGQDLMAADSRGCGGAARFLHGIQAVRDDIGRIRRLDG
jgi:hypothetical protein